jgi:quinol monooxygenase YgiN
VSFIQIIEFTTSQAGELDSLIDEWLEGTQGKRTGTRGVEARDRDRPNAYVRIVEFPSYEAAMANSKLPETAEFAARMAELCDGPPTFRNLDVLREMR